MSLRRVEGEGGIKSRDLLTDQGAEQVDGLQQQLLVPHPGHAQRLQLLVGQPQQLLPVHLLLLEGGDVRLQAVVQTLGGGTGGG